MEVTFGTEADTLTFQLKKNQRSKSDELDKYKIANSVSQGNIIWPVNIGCVYENYWITKHDF